MKLLYSLLLVTWFTCTFNNSDAQKTPRGYIVKDSTYSMGKVVQLRRGRIQFQRSKKDTPVIYNALEIKEYGDDEKVYESLVINGNQTFLKRIVRGKANLYQGRSLYVLKIDSSLILFNKKDYRSVIGASIKCNGKDQTLSKLTYSKVALRNYVNSYNLNKCNLDNFPYKKFGAFAGYNLFQFNAFFEKSLTLKQNIATPTVGIFYDFPVYRPRSLFLTTELNWLYGKTFFYNENKNNSNYFAVNVNGVNSMFSTKWMLNQQKIKSYFKIGALISFLNTTSPTGVIKTTSNDDVINITRRDISKSSTFLYGLTSGIGMEVPLKKRKNFHFEIRYLKTFYGSF
jgi:hypothetical protein